jgi:TonB family protein
MFDFAISQHQKHPPTRRVFASLVASCLLHLLAVLILIRFPGLLSPGMNRWLRQPSLLLSVFSPGSGQQGQDSEWRTVTFVGGSSKGKMTAPSAATLRQNMYDWSKNANQGSPPIRVRWGNEKQGPLSESPETAAKFRPVPGIQEPKAEDAAAAERAAEAARSGAGEAPAGGSPGVQVAGADSGGGKGTVYLPAPKPAAEAKTISKPPETSPDRAPSSIPAGIRPPATEASTAPPATAAQAKPEAKVFENEQKAIRAAESGLFDTRGFDLGEYANNIIERVKGNWMIPSNLRNSQGRTTVIFYIDRDGRFTNARIVASSGSSSLDLAALNAVIESNPFPPLPKGFPGDHVGAKFVFSYNERQ